MLPSTRTTKSPSLPRASQSSPRRARVSREVTARRTAASVLGARTSSVSPSTPMRARAKRELRASRWTAPSRRTSAARLGRPVIGSVRDSSSSSGSTSATGARVTSRQYSTRAPTSGSERRSRTVAWISRHRPSACRTRAVRTASSLCRLGGPFSAPSSVGASSGWTAASRGCPSTHSGSSPSRSVMASETKVTRSRSSRMTTGSTLLLTSVRNEVWLRRRAPASRCCRCQSTACEPTRAGQDQEQHGDAGRRRDGDEDGGEGCGARETRTGTARIPARPLGGAPGMQPPAAPDRGWSRPLYRVARASAAASLPALSPDGGQGRSTGPPTASRASSRGPRPEPPPSRDDLSSGGSGRSRSHGPRRATRAHGSSGGWCCSWRPPRVLEARARRAADPAQVAVLLRRAEHRRREAARLRGSWPLGDRAAPTSSST